MGGGGHLRKEGMSGASPEPHEALREAHSGLDDGTTNQASKNQDTPFWAKPWQTLGREAPGLPTRR